MLYQFSRTQLLLGQDGMERRQVPGSNAFVPAAAGLIVAGEVVKDLSAWGKPQ